MKTSITREITCPRELDALHELVAALVGRTCWRARLGYGDELTLDVGRRVRRSVGSVETAQSERGEWVLRARASAWTIASTGSSLPDSPNATWELLPLIEGATITEVEVSYPSLSLLVCFENGYRLELTAELEPDDQDPLAHWELFGASQFLLEAGPGPRWHLSRGGESDSIPDSTPP